MGARFGLAYIINQFGEQYSNLLSLLLVLPAIGFTYIYWNGLRKTGGEVFGEKIWWDHLRPFHALMYFLTAVLVYTKNKRAYLLIIADTLVGLCAFTRYHLSK